MTNKPYIVALVGSYRKNGVISSAVEEILASAGESGAETKNVFLPDTHIEFCTNCRSCTQEEGSTHGKCVLDGSMDEGFYLGLSGTVQRQLKTAAGLLGATPAGVLSIELAAQQIDQELDERSRKKARMLGKQLVEAVR